MSNTDNTTREWRDEVSSDRRSMMGMIRRMAVRLTEGGFWQVVGHLLFDNRTLEVREAELFGGTLGFYSRPIAGANAEAVVWNREGSDPIIIATRDEDLRKLFPLAQGETLQCNRATIILCKPNGTVEIRTPAGAALALPTLADYNALRDAFNAHVHTSAASGSPTSAPVPGPTPLIPVASPSGTTVLKAQ